MEQQAKLIKRSEDEYAVFIPRGNLVNGDFIGTVYKCWYRNCGQGWTNSTRRAWGFRTRKKAVSDLIKRSKSDTC